MSELPRRRKLADASKPSQSEFRAFVLALLLTAGVWPGCDEQRRDTQRGNVLTIGLDAAPLTLDPRYASDAAGSQISGLLSDGLIRVDARGRPLPQLASRWASPDPLHYVFELRPDARFADGSPLTVADVQATFESVLAPQSGSPKRGGLGPLQRVEQLDSHRVRFVLSEPFAPFLDACSMGILPATQVAVSPQAPLPAAAGVGPFRLRQFLPDEAVVLERNPDYPLGSPRLEGAVFRVIPDATTRLLALERGSIDLVQNGIEPLTLAWLHRREQLRVVVSPGTTFQYLGMNLRQPPLSDARVRQALAFGVDRTAIIDGLLGGLAQPANGLLGPSNWAYTAKVRSYPYDPRRAAELLDAAGYADPDGAGPRLRFRLLYKTTTVDLRRRIAEALQSQLRDVGIGLEIQSNEWATFYSDVRAGRFELFSLAWVGIQEPDLYYLAFHSGQQPPLGSNRGGFNDPVVDFLTARARRGTSQAERRRLYEKVQRRLGDLLPVVPLWWTSNVAVLHRRVHGYRLAPEGGYDALRTAWIEGYGT